MTSKINVLLINPWIYDFTAYDFWMKPLGLLYVAALLEQYTSFELSFIDCLDRHHPGLMTKRKTKPDGRGPFFKEEVAKPSVLKDVPRKYSRYGLPLPLFHHELSQIPSPDLVLLTCTMTYWYPGVQLAVEQVRQMFGSVPIALGGVYASLMPGHAEKETGVDFVLDGPAEKTVDSLVRELFDHSASEEIHIDRLEDMPWPSFHLLNVKETLTLLTSRGCPFNCSFCASPLLVNGFDQISPDPILSLIEYTHSMYGTRNFAFYDDALLLNKKNHIIPILEGIIEKSFPVAFHTPNGLHVKEIDANLASLLWQAHFQSLFLSQESFDEDILDDACSKVAPGDLDVALRHLIDAGYDPSQINVYLIAGLPGQETEGIKESIRYVQASGARPRLAYFSPVPGTMTWKRMVKLGVLDLDTDPLLHNKLTFPYLWSDVSPEDFVRLKELASKWGQT
jgi:radical SAM superfamily enzyme YgiQ (UPF0313 family)